MVGPRTAGPAPGRGAYDRRVLSDLRGPDGGPAAGVRLVAVLVVLGLVVLTAPLVVVPLLRALLSAVL